MGRGKKHQCRRPDNYVDKDDKQNDMLEEYYRKTFNWSDDEWQRFYSAVISELPATFRVTGFRDHSKEVQWMIKNKFIENLINPSEEKGPLAKRLEWYPNDLAWQLEASKMEIRRNVELKKLHQYLVSETNCGFISRQEAVSMLPPLLLNIEPNHKVLDLCAAPGSKTAQLIEMLHAGTDGVPTGVVVANDIDNKRCYMMVHQLQRLQSPCVIVVRQDASIFPKIYLPNADVKAGESPMLFDRILVDVPCSGDGTLRKNPTLWSRWSPYLGVNEHFLQMKIFRRALEMLAEGGQMVYSTCSLNPVEDEAVIASVLSQCDGAARLVDIGTVLPSLVAEHGLTSWRIMLKDKTWCNTIDDVPQDQRRCLRSSLFPPANVEKLHLEYCRRIMPQHQNTGGFFLALIEKVTCLPWMNARKHAQLNNGSVGEEGNDVIVAANQIEEQQGEISQHQQTVAKGPVKKKPRIYKEDPFYYFSDDDADWLKIQSFYGIDKTFPHRQLMYRNQDGRRRNFYFTNELVQQIVRQNADRGVNFVNLGVKLFGVSEDRMFNGYRILQEGIEIIQPYLQSTTRRMRIPSRTDLLTLLTYDMPLITEFSEQLQQHFEQFSVGPIVFEYNPAAVINDGDSLEKMPRIILVFAGWRGFGSIRHYVGVHERSHLMRLCGVEPTEIKVAARKGSQNLEENEEEPRKSDAEDQVGNEEINE